MKRGKIGDKDFTVAQDKQDQLEQDLAQLLQQAHDLGTQYGNTMIDKQQEAVSAKDIAIGLGIAYFLKRAKDVVSRIVTRMSNTVSDIVSKGGDAKEVVGNMMDYVPDQVSATEIHYEVEDGVFAVLKRRGVMYVEWVTEPGACELCLGNEADGAIEIGTGFSSGEDRPPAHVNCRCNVYPAI